LLQPLEALFHARFTLGPPLLDHLLLFGSEHREDLIAVLLRELIDLLSLGLAQIETAQLDARRSPSGPAESPAARTARSRSLRGGSRARGDECHERRAAN
jgi:hypothetical protein